MHLRSLVIDTGQSREQTGRTMTDAILILTLATALGAGIAGGTFFAFSTFVMAALGRVPAPEGIRAMQEINVNVINPWFMTALFGTGLACVAVAIAAVADWDGSYGPYLLVAAALYVLGCVGVTMWFNVPRNTVLAKQEPESAGAAEIWRRYLVEWTTWNTVRTVASLGALGLLICAVAAG
jgi:uncharacterized membrane protein